MEALAALIGVPAAFILLALPVSYVAGWRQKNRVREQRRRRYFYAYLLGFFVAAPFLGNPKMPPWAALAALAPVLLVMRAYRKSRTEDRAQNEILEGVAKKERDTLDCGFIMQTLALRMVMKHLKTIITKYGQAIHRDDYGNIRLADARREIEYFINEVVKPHIRQQPCPSHIDPVDYTLFVAANLADPEYLNPPIAACIEAFACGEGSEGWANGWYEAASAHLINLVVARNGSVETLRAMAGDDYAAIGEKGARHIEAKEPLSLDALDYMMATLIPDAELEALEIWYVMRHGVGQDLAELQSGQEFELYCKRRLEALGWQVQTTRASGDFGADLVAQRDASHVIIQCKFYSQPVGVKAVQEAFAAKQFYNANKAAVLSNQTYTRAAQQMAQKNGVILLNVHDLEALV